MVRIPDIFYFVKFIKTYLMFLSGVVTTAYDSVRKIDLAIKRIRPYANDEWDARHTLREIRLLKLLGNHPNVSILTNKSFRIETFHADFFYRFR